MFQEVLMPKLHLEHTVDEEKIKDQKYNTTPYKEA